MHCVLPSSWPALSDVTVGSHFSVPRPTGPWWDLVCGCVHPASLAAVAERHVGPILNDGRWHGHNPRHRAAFVFTSSAMVGCHSLGAGSLQDTKQGSWPPTGSPNQSARVLPWCCPIAPGCKGYNHRQNSAGLLVLLQCL